MYYTPTPDIYSVIKFTLNTTPEEFRDLLQADFPNETIGYPYFIRNSAEFIAAYFTVERWGSKVGHLTVPRRINDVQFSLTIKHDSPGFFGEVVEPGVQLSPYEDVYVISDGADA